MLNVIKKIIVHFAHAFILPISQSWMQLLQRERSGNAVPAVVFLGRRGCSLFDPLGQSALGSTNTALSVHKKFLPRFTTLKYLTIHCIGGSCSTAKSNSYMLNHKQNLTSTMHPLHHNRTSIRLIVCMTSLGFVIPAQISQYRFVILKVATLQNSPQHCTRNSPGYECQIMSACPFLHCLKVCTRLRRLTLYAGGDATPSPNSGISTCSDRVHANPFILSALVYKYFQDFNIFCCYFSGGKLSHSNKLLFSG